jgi:uncharacterized membrane protein
MLHSKASKFAILAAVSLLGVGASRSAHAQQQWATEWSPGSIVNLGGLPGSTQSVGLGINEFGTVVGRSDF